MSIITFVHRRNIDLNSHISYTSAITNNHPMIISLFRLHSLHAFSHERCGSNFRAVFFKRIIHNSSLGTCCKVALRHPQSLQFINFIRHKCNSRYICKVFNIVFCIMIMCFISICQIGHCYCFRNTTDEKDRPDFSNDLCHVYIPYPEPVYTGRSSVHWNATGMPMVDPVYTGIPLGDPANTCRVHWNTTGKT